MLIWTSDPVILNLFLFLINYFNSKPSLGVMLDNDLKLAAQYGSMVNFSFFHLVISFTAL